MGKFAIKKFRVVIVVFILSFLGTGCDEIKTPDPSYGSSKPSGASLHGNQNQVAVSDFLERGGSRQLTFKLRLSDRSDEPVVTDYIHNFPNGGYVIERGSANFRFDVKHRTSRDRRGEHYVLEMKNGKPKLVKKKATFYTVSTTVKIVSLLDRSGQIVELTNTSSYRCIKSSDSGCKKAKRKALIKALDSLKPPY